MTKTATYWASFDRPRDRDIGHELIVFERDRMTLARAREIAKRYHVWARLRDGRTNAEVAVMKPDGTFSINFIEAARRQRKTTFPVRGRRGHAAGRAGRIITGAEVRTVGGATYARVSWIDPDGRTGHSEGLRSSEVMRRFLAEAKQAGVRVRHVLQNEAVSTTGFAHGHARMYRVIWKNDLRKTWGVMADGPLTHKEATTILSKISPRRGAGKAVRFLLEEIPRSGRSDLAGLARGRARAGETAYDAEILAGIARGPWASHWADREQERGRRLGGVDVYDAAPPAPRWAHRWARDAAGAIVKASPTQEGRVPTLTELYERAQALGYARDAESFGSHLGMEFVGHGVGWTDDVRASRAETNAAIVIPHGEFYERAARFYSHRY